MSKRPLHLANPRLYLVYYRHPSLLSYFNHSIHVPDYISNKMYDERVKAEQYYNELLNEADEKIAECLKIARLDYAHTQYMQDIENDFRRPFHDGHAIVNYDDWINKIYWTIEDVCALTYGKNPLYVTKSMIDEYYPHSPFARQYTSSYDVLMRAITSHELSDKIVPSQFKTWAKKRKYDFPTEILSQIKSTKQSVSKTPPENEFKELSTRQKNTMLKIIYGLAMAKYNYKPDLAKNSAATNMHTSLATQGIDISAETINKFLNEAKALKG